MEIKKGVSEASDEQKTEKNGFPTPRMSKKQEKTALQPLGWAKNWKKWLSNPLDEQKTEKNGFPTPWKQKDRYLSRIHNMIFISKIKIYARK